MIPLRTARWRVSVTTRSGPLCQLHFASDNPVIALSVGFVKRPLVRSARLTHCPPMCARAREGAHDARAPPPPGQEVSTPPPNEVFLSQQSPKIRKCNISLLPIVFKCSALPQDVPYCAISPLRFDTGRATVLLCCRAFFLSPATGWLLCSEAPRFSLAGGLYFSLRAEVFSDHEQHISFLRV